MDKIVKQTIDARKNAIFSSYNVTDKAILKRIEDLFKRINEFGEDFDDVNAFEAAFANDSLNIEYTNIFVELAQKDMSSNMPSVGEMVADRIGNDIKNRVMPSRAVIADERDKMIRDIPVVGDVIEAGKGLDLLNNIRKSKKSK